MPVFCLHEFCGSQHDPDDLRLPFLEHIVLATAARCGTYRGAGLLVQKAFVVVGCSVELVVIIPPRIADLWLRAGAFHLCLVNVHLVESREYSLQPSPADSGCPTCDAPSRACALGDLNFVEPAEGRLDVAIGRVLRCLRRGLPFGICSLRTS